jgi:UDP-4-amino-4,6-dideoxy-N-acetyl-beta-L-altrosamine transaminase
MLPYGRQCIEDDDVAAVVAALRRDYLTTGPAVEAFEAALANRVGATYAIACSSGTAALHLAAMALGLGPQDVVVVPSMTFVATANTVRLTGAEVVFSDVDGQSGLVRPEDLAEALKTAGNRKPQSVFAVHINGQTADIAGLSKIAAAHGLSIVEDAAHAIGATATSDSGVVIPVGQCSHSAMTAFSFHPVKTITMGEGGAVTTNNGRLAARLRRLRNHGITRNTAELLDRNAAFDKQGKANPWYYEMHEPGLNYRASDLHCALGLSQLKKLDQFITRRCALTNHYDALLADLAPLVQPVKRVPNCDPAWHLYAILIDFVSLGMERAVLMHRLSAKGIGTQVHYIPVHRQPYYRARYGNLNFPGADAYYARQLSLPLFPTMTYEDVERVVDTLTSIVQSA